MRLSVLDPSPIFEGRSAEDAFAETRALAKLTDRLGYHRYWVQEHHNSESFAGTAPEVLIPVLATETERIRVGAGGIMLPNYSPLKVAEQFMALTTLFPARIDLGIGRATGADQRTSSALMGPGAKDFPSMLQLLLSWVLDSTGEQPLPEGHPARGIAALPNGTRPCIAMLSSSEQSAAFAGAMGLPVAFADFLSPGGAAKAFNAYREAFEPSIFAPEPHAILALVCLAAETGAEAEAAASTARAWSLYRAQGQFPPFLRPENAQKLLDDAGPSPLRDMVEQRAVIGDTVNVKARLEALQQETGANELMLLTIAHDPEVRARSYELLATPVTSDA